MIFSDEADEWWFLVNTIGLAPSEVADLSPIQRETIGRLHDRDMKRAKRKKRRAGR